VGYHRPTLGSKGNSAQSDHSFSPIGGQSPLGGLYLGQAPALA
jgi:hypothetical protein